MMKIGKIIMMVVAVVCFSACGTTRSTSPYTVGTKLEIQMSDLQFLGESNIECEYDTYLGFIRHIVSINGEEYIPGKDVKLRLPQGMLNFNSKAMNLAAAKVLKDYPQATYFMVVMDTKETDVAFLGSSTRRVAKVRAYKFK